MTAKILGLILSSIALSSTGQLLMKLGMASGRVQAALASTPFEALIAAVTTLPVFGGLFCYGLASVLWLLVLARIDLALAYPFVGLNFLLKASNKTASDPVNQAEEAELRGLKQFSRMSCGESSTPSFPPRPPALKAGAGASLTVRLSPAFFSCCAPPSPGRTDPRSWAGAAA